MAESEEERTDEAPSAKTEAPAAVAGRPARSARADADAATPLARPGDKIVTEHEDKGSERRRELSRRAVLRSGFFGTMGLMLAGMAYQTWNFLWPRNLQGFGGAFFVAKERVPKPGEEPVRIVEGKFWLVNLKPEDGTHGSFGEAGSGGLLALYQKCPHLGCTVPWRGTFEFEGKTGWFRCPCHGSTYTKGGVRVFGPAPRPLDTMAVTVLGDGSIEVNTGTITRGAVDNPKRAVPYNV